MTGFYRLVDACPAKHFYMIIKVKQNDGRCDPGYWKPGTKRAIMKIIEVCDLRIPGIPALGTHTKH